MTTTELIANVVSDEVVPACAPWSAIVRADADTLVLVSNCPQINNPCNGFNPTEVRMVISAQ